MTTIDRRTLLKRGAAVTAGTLLASTGTQALAAHGALAASGRRGNAVKAPDNGGYGPLAPVKDRTTGLPLLFLPAGFEYASFGHEASYAQELSSSLGLDLATLGSDGRPTPGRHDGMAAFATSTPGTIRLVRNHEQGYDPVAANARRDYDRVLIGDAGDAYDPTAAGGCTTMTFDTRTLTMTRSFISLNGTSVNCAGGIYGSSWLTCEETDEGTENGFAQDHGYIFEVPSQQDVPVSKPVPYKEMGRFRHEAVAVDPASGIVYETEDAGRTDSGFYRFLPNDPADLSAGGRLQMLAVKDQPRFATYEGVADRVGNPLPVTWVDVPRPDPRPSDLSVFEQGAQAGGAAFARLEGCWFDGGSVFFNATSGGDARAGQVWEYRPRGRSGGQLILVFESPSAEVLDAPDNITVSPRGGLVLCEDGGGEQYVRGLNERGEIFDVAVNNVDEDNNEFAGACFSPDGDVMFVNVQTPGVSFAIRGPWEKGSL